MKKLLVFFSALLPVCMLFSQQNDLRIRLNEDGSRYFKLTVVNQVWLRFTDHNPGSAVFKDPVNQSFDIGIRRLRFQAFGQITDRVFLYTQFGQNNLTFMQTRFTGAFFHDAVAEYKMINEKLSMGAGLTGWGGPGRYASPAVASILTLDAPLYMQTTNSVSDQFLRKLSVYAKGKISRIDYRLALSNPMSVQTGNVSNPSDLDSIHAAFSPKHPRLQTQGYFQWEFFDRESNLTPYTTGTYLGNKKVLNAGTGFVYQPDAMWQQENNGKDTAYKPLLLFNADLFCDLPLNKTKGNALTLYAAYNYFSMGRNYIRSVGVMNPANGTVGNSGINGAGNAFPMIGTGQTVYANAGYLFGNKTLPSGFRLQVFGATQLSKFDALKDAMAMYEGGLHLYTGNSTLNKLSFCYQSRPVYSGNSNGEAVVNMRKGMAVIQLQAGI